MSFKPMLSLLLTMSLFSGCDSNDQINTGESKDDTQTLKNAKKVSDNLVLTDTNGKKIKVTKTSDGYTFSGYEGKAVLLSFFASWCSPCIAEIPHLNNLQEIHDRKLQIIGILLEEKELKEVQSFIKYENIKYTVAYGLENFKMADNVGGVNTIPYMILYNTDGSYATHYVGAIPEEMINADIKKVLK